MRHCKKTHGFFCTHAKKTGARDTDGREVDFVVMVDREPVSFIECKLGDGGIGAGMRYLKQRLPQVDAWQVAARTTRDYLTRDGVRVAPVLRLLDALK